MHRAITLLLTSLAIIPSTALFIGLLTASLRQQRLALEWPQLVEPTHSGASELLIASLPGILAFLLTAPFMRRRTSLTASYLGSTLLAAGCAAFVFAQAFGNTWSSREIILGLVVMQLHLFTLAALPGALLVALCRSPSGH